MHKKRDKLTDMALIVEKKKNPVGRPRKAIAMRQRLHLRVGDEVSVAAERVGPEVLREILTEGLRQRNLLKA